VLQAHIEDFPLGAAELLCSLLSTLSSVDRLFTAAATGKGLSPMVDRLVRRTTSAEDKSSCQNSAFRKGWVSLSQDFREKVSSIGNIFGFFGFTFC